MEENCSDGNFVKDENGNDDITVTDKNCNDGKIVTDTNCNDDNISMDQSSTEGNIPMDKNSTDQNIETGNCNDENIDSLFTEICSRERIQEIAVAASIEVDRNSFNFFLDESTGYFLSELPYFDDDRSPPTKKSTPRNPNAKSFPCQFCGKTFSLGSILREHLRLHTGSKPYQCNQCPASFTQSATLRTHKFIHTGEWPYKCNLCPKKYRFSQALKDHLVTHQGKMPYQCEVCPKGYHSRKGLMYHLQGHTNEFSFKCDFCEKVFKSRSTLQYHLLGHTGEKPHPCKFCDKSFRSKGDLKSHELGHTGLKPYNCPMCPKSFRTTCLLKAHTRVHTGERPFPCPHCPLAFKQRAAMRRHLAQHSAVRPYQCTFCSSGFNDPDCFVVHMREYHTGETPFKCDLCDQAFPSNRKLKDHKLSSHMLERPFKCTECNWSAKRQSHYNSHLKMHLEQKTCGKCLIKFETVSEVKEHDETHYTWECDLCYTVFDNRLALEDHCVICTETLCDDEDEELWTCNLCLQDFSNYVSLEDHCVICKKCIVTTEEEFTDKQKPLYRCYPCSMTFMIEADLALHRSTHKAKKIFDCVVCFKVLATFQSLCRHNLKYHSSNPSIVIPTLLSLGSSGDASELNDHETAPENETAHETGLDLEVTESDNDEPLIDLDIHQSDSEEVASFAAFRCDTCSKTFVNRQALVDHASSAHFKIMKAKSKSTLSSKKNNLSGLRNHTLQDLEITASDNDKTLTEINVHNSTPKEVTSFTCELCSKNFASRRSLIGHISAAHRKLMKNNNNSKINTLPSLENIGKLRSSNRRTFDTKNLKGNKSSPAPSGPRNVRGNKPTPAIDSSINKTSTKETSSKSKVCYKCQQCSEEFRSQYLLNRHTKTHKEPFQCPVCLKCFDTKLDLESHKTHHGTVDDLSNVFNVSVSLRRIGLTTTLPEENTPPLVNPIGASIQVKTEPVEELNSLTSNTSANFSTELPIVKTEPIVPATPEYFPALVQTIKEEPVQENFNHENPRESIISQDIVYESYLLPNQNSVDVPSMNTSSVVVKSEVPEISEPGNC